MMRKLLLLLLCLYGFPALAQVGPISITSSQCASIAVGSGNATVGIVVTGTWTGTLQPEVAIQGQPTANTQVTPSTSTTPTSTVTANGTYTASVAGMSTFSLCGNTVGSGTATVYLNVSTASASKGGAGTPGGTLASSIAALNTAQTAPSGTVHTQCPSAVNPFAWFEMTDGSWMPWMGVDTASPGQTGVTAGVVTHCYKEFFNDTGSTPQAGSTQDDALEIYHLTNTAIEPGGSYGLYIRSQLPTTASSTLNIRPGGEYVEEFLQGNPGTIGSGVDAGTFGLRAQLTDSRNGTACSGQNGCGPVVGLDSEVFDNTAAQGVIPNTYGVRGGVQLEPNNGAAGNAIAAGVTGFLNATGASGDSGRIGYTIFAQAPTGVLSDFSFLTEFKNDDVSSLGSSPPSDTYAYYDTGGDIFLSGQSAATSILWTPQLNGTKGPLVINGSPSILGGIATTQYTLPAAGNIVVVNGGTAGSTSYSYIVVARDSAGGTIASAAKVTATGNATLDATNFNQIRLNGALYQNGAVAFFDIYRSASSGSPSSTGKIGTINPSIFRKSDLAAATEFSFNDTGIAGDSSTAPTGNSTGGIAPAGPLNQTATKNFAGTCAMSAGTTCTWTLNSSYHSTPICIATQQATSTVIAGECSISGTTVTITAASSNSNTWGAMVVGNPN